MRILLVEDNVDLSAAITMSLARDGYTITPAYDGVQALDRLIDYEFDAVILDRDLPRMSGDSVCREIRTSGQDIPIIMLTALTTVRDRVSGLDLGADDYLTKPFAYEELAARLRALRRRGTAPISDEITVGALTVDRARGNVIFDGRSIRVSPKEFAVIEALARAEGRHLTVERLLDVAWDAPDDISRSVVKVTMHSLRRKLAPDLIVHDPGFGYRLETS
ncbi:DNA-binding response OmpR family regulator [Microbacterium paludicola]|uniref:DNA-binding response OmpR family regulator n=1 Tax=Microbacterium paludicola TaxID=300019 RepID=A0ABU1HYC0_9MICO|nr:response regulator transcription factor [Microbacterium paludicola]MDR6165873.1 DNA-binding response OmpR family regulator [Microbacterium paludicola]